jgi:hypothetical protein
MSFRDKTNKQKKKETDKLFGIPPDLLIQKSVWACTDLMLRNRRNVKGNSHECEWFVSLSLFETPRDSLLQKCKSIFLPLKIRRRCYHCTDIIFLTWHLIITNKNAYTLKCHNGIEVRHSSDMKMRKVWTFPMFLLCELLISKTLLCNCRHRITISLR